MKTLKFAGAAIAVSIACLSTAAEAGCVTKAAKATAGSTESAKWYVMETMVQAVSWGLWPGWLSTGKVEGYSVHGERYSCKPDGGQVTCRGRANFCTKG
ncbi:MAG: hypothetical protein ACKVP4_00710 [Hyphomicrobium sp.]